MEKKHLSVLDFGGSLGSTYFQNRNFFNDVQLQWSIIEQSNFVEYGRMNFANEKLNFYNSISDCLTKTKPNVAVISSVLQYLSEPEEIITEICNLDLDYLIIDRTSFVNTRRNILTIQTVPKEIYEASYPCWFFNEELLMKAFWCYEIVMDWHSEFEQLSITLNGEYKGYWKGFLLKKNNAD